MYAKVVVNVKLVTPAAKPVKEGVKLVEGEGTEAPLSAVHKYVVTAFATIGVVKSEETGT